MGGGGGGSGGDSRRWLGRAISVKIALHSAGAAAIGRRGGGRGGQLSSRVQNGYSVPIVCLHAPCWMPRSVQKLSQGAGNRGLLVSQAQVMLHAQEQLRKGE